MGRRTLSPERVAQILDAYGEALARYGVAGATIGRVSELSGLAPSHVRHYVGAFEHVPRLFHERLLVAYVDSYEVLACSLPAGEKARGLVIGFFGPSADVSPSQQAVLAAVSMAGTDPHIQDHVLAGFSRLIACFASALAADAPHRTSEDARSTGYVVVSLLFGHWVLRGAGLPADRQAGVIAHAAAIVDAFLVAPGDAPSMSESYPWAPERP